MTLIDRSAVHDPSWPTQVDIYDTTLRRKSAGGHFADGRRQAAHRRAARPPRCGVHRGGWPGANPKDDEFFERAKTLDLSTSTFVAFGSTRRAKGKVDGDQTLTNLVAAGTEVVCIVGKCWDYHVTEALKTTLDEGVAMVADSVEYLVAQGKRVFFDAEHFFDGFKRNPEFSLRVVEAAAMAGAEAVVLCDTNGGSLPPDVEAAVAAVVAHIDCGVGIHSTTTRLWRRQRPRCRAGGCHPGAGHDQRLWRTGRQQDPCRSWPTSPRWVSSVAGGASRQPHLGCPPCGRARELLGRPAAVAQGLDGVRAQGRPAPRR